MAINKYPYTDYNEYNLDWIIRKLMQLEKRENVKAFVVNIADFVPVLNDGTFAEAVEKALDVSSYIYVPKGEYRVNVGITRDCSIFFDEEAVVTSTQDAPAFNFSNCSPSIYGGKCYAGDDDFDATTTEEKELKWIYPYGITRENLAIFEVHGCHDILVEGLQCDHSKFPGILKFSNCYDIEVARCSFQYFLTTGVFFSVYNKNMNVHDCSFKHIYPRYAQDPDRGHETWCYAVVTGGMTASGQETPPDGLRVANCYVEDSYDCGIDTHGATNVIFENNKCINCRTSITAYNDNARIERPEGWVMRNITIRNNYCVSDKTVLTEGWKHPFIYVGNSNPADVNANGKHGSMKAYQNLIIENNYFESPNYHSDNQNSLVYTANGVYGARIANNVCKGLTSVPHAFTFYHCFDVEFVNNQMDDFSSNPVLVMHGSLNEFGNSSADRFIMYSHVNYLYSYIKGINESDNLNIGPRYVGTLHAFGDIMKDSSDLNTYLTTSSGLTLVTGQTMQAQAAQFSVDVDDGIVEYSDIIPLIPKQYITLTSGGVPVNCLVTNLIDTHHMVVKKVSDGSVPADGTYTLDVVTETRIQLDA